MAAQTTTSPRLGVTKYLHVRPDVDSMDFSGDQTKDKYYYNTVSAGAETSFPSGYVKVENPLTDEISLAKGDYVL